MSTLIGVFGGTFNPIHLGHVSIAQQVSQALDFNQVRFIPAAHPPHKPTPQVSVEQRVHMVQLAIQNYPNFVLDRTELERTGPSYTVDTLNQLHQTFPQANLCLILGWDAFSKLNTWHAWQSLFELTHIALVHRPHQSQDELPPILKTEFEHRFSPSNQAKTLMRAQNAGIISLVPTLPIAISSTDLRQQLSDGKMPQDALSPAVITFIKQHNLYKN